MFRFTGPVGYNGVETEGFVYLQSGSVVSLNMCVLCVLSFSPCYFCTRLQHCYTSSTYTCLNPYSYTFYPLSWGKHSVISWTLPRLQIAEKLWEIRLSKKMGKPNGPFAEEWAALHGWLCGATRANKNGCYSCAKLFSPGFHAGKSSWWGVASD